ncbi:hypothetical protein ACIQ7Q_10445 [Streptomyces sp. NPDC096176]|uniref:hypothetical protein n=1 Tax=Streptomyces sp. NPDC096176 TaxID=3366079 RepID=UPI0038015626
MSGHSGTTGTFVSAAAALHCPHGGRVFATSAPSDVRIDGLPVHTGSDTFAVSGCTHTIDRVPHPCTSVRWSPHAGGVLVDGKPALLDTTEAVCVGATLVPQGPPVVLAARHGVMCR